MHPSRNEFEKKVMCFSSFNILTLQSLETPATTDYLNTNHKFRLDGKNLI